VQQYNQVILKRLKSILESMPSISLLTTLAREHPYLAPLLLKEGNNVFKSFQDEIKNKMLDNLSRLNF